MTKFFRKASYSGGFGVIEMMVYVAILSGVFGSIFALMLSMYRASETARASRSIDLSATLALERMLREIRDANSVLVASSTLGTNPGTLVLNSTNASTTGGTYKFYLQNSQLFMQYANGTNLPLTATDTLVTNLVFYRMSATNSQAVRTKMTITDSRSDLSYSRNFSITGVLRESYVQ